MCPPGGCNHTAGPGRAAAGTGETCYHDFGMSPRASVCLRTCCFSIYIFSFVGFTGNLSLLDLLIWHGSQASGREESRLSGVKQQKHGYPLFCAGSHGSLHVSICQKLGIGPKWQSPLDPASMKAFDPPKPQMSHLLKPCKMMKVSKGQSQPQKVAEIRLRIILEARFWVIRQFSSLLLACFWVF